jgi:AcrR family transcriptional regulator
MSRKPSVSREELIEAAFRLIRREGHEALSARSLAAEIGCSTQPVMYRFSNLAELRELVYRRADRFHTDYVLSAGSLQEIGLRYIRFAAEEAPLFRFLFQSGHFDGESIQDMIHAPESAEILQAAAAGLALPAEEAASVFEALFLTVHGCASLIANNALRYEPAALEQMLLSLAESLTGKETQS